MYIIILSHIVTYTYLGTRKVVLPIFRRYTYIQTYMYTYVYIPYTYYRYCGRRTESVGYYFVPRNIILISEVFRLGPSKYKSKLETAQLSRRHEKKKLKNYFLIKPRL